jgi:hypothetical protein
MITDLIDISRCHHSTAYLSQKQSIPSEITHIQTFNITGRDHLRRQQEVAKLEITCVSNT